MTELKDRSADYRAGYGAGLARAAQELLEDLAELGDPPPRKLRSLAAFLRERATEFQSAAEEIR